jgi:membrane protein
VSGPVRGRIWRFVHLSGQAAWRAFNGFYRGDNLIYASAIAYWTLMSLLPVTMLALAVVSRVSEDADTRRAMLDFVLQYFPARVDVMRRELDGLAASPVRLGLAGSAFMLWSALGVFGAVSTAVNHAWGVEQPRSFWSHRLFSLLMLVVAGLLLAVALTLATASKIADANWFAGVLRRFPGLAVLGSVAVEMTPRVLFVGVVGLVFYFVPNTRVRFRDVWLGALLTGALWSLTLEGLAWIYGDVGRFPLVSGSLAAVVVFLFWVYAQAAILLYGVQFTAAYARLLNEPRESPLR